MDTLVGDAMLTGAFLAYAGYFDQQLRDHLFHRWTDAVQSAAIVYRHDLARIEYLSSADDRLQWQKNALPVCFLSFFLIFRLMISALKMLLCFTDSTDIH